MEGTGITDGVHAERHSPGRSGTPSQFNHATPNWHRPILHCNAMRFRCNTNERGRHGVSIREPWSHGTHRRATRSDAQREVQPTIATCGRAACGCSSRSVAHPSQYPRRCRTRSVRGQAETLAVRKFTVAAVSGWGLAQSSTPSSGRPCPPHFLLGDFMLPTTTGTTADSSTVLGRPQAWTNGQSMACTDNSKAGDSSTPSGVPDSLESSGGSFSATPRTFCTAVAFQSQPN